MELLAINKRKKKKKQPKRNTGKEYEQNWTEYKQKK